MSLLWDDHQYGCYSPHPASAAAASTGQNHALYEGSSTVRFPAEMFPRRGSFLGVQPGMPFENETNLLPVGP